MASHKIKTEIVSLIVTKINRFFLFVFFPKNRKYSDFDWNSFRRLVELVELDVTASPLTAKLTEIVFYACSLLFFCVCVCEHVERDASGGKSFVRSFVRSHIVQHLFVSEMKLDSGFEKKAYIQQIFVKFNAHKIDSSIQMWCRKYCPSNKNGSNLP